MRICKKLLTKMQNFLPFTARFSVFEAKLTVEKEKIAGKPRLHFTAGYGMIGKMKGVMPCEKSEKYTACDQYGAVRFGSINECGTARF